jgi:VanZ family protein
LFLTPRAPSLRWGWVFLAYVLFVLYLSFYPFEFVPRVRPFSLDWYWIATRRVVIDFTLNVWFYVPLGAVAFLSFGRRFWAFLLAVITGTLLSLAVEFGQLYVPERYSGGPDFVANAIGTLIGAALAYAGSGIGLGRSASNFVYSPHWRLSPDQILLLAFWILGQGFPLFPDLNFVRLFSALRSFTHFPTDWSQSLQTFLQFLILTIALRGSSWIWIAFAMIPAQTLLQYHGFSLPNLIAAAAAWATGSLLKKRSSPILAVVVLLGILAEELRPFRIAPVQTSFGWVPFESFMSGNVTELSASIIFGKMLLYGGTVWLMRISGWRPWIATVAVAVVLAVGEWLQRSIPGRVAESTDVVLALAGGVLILALMRRGNQIAAR